MMSPLSPGPHPPGPSVGCFEDPLFKVTPIITLLSFAEPIILQEIFFNSNNCFSSLTVEKTGWWRDTKEVSLNPQPEEVEPGPGSGWEATVPTELVPG